MFFSGPEASSCTRVKKTLGSSKKESAKAPAELGGEESDLMPFQFIGSIIYLLPEDIFSKQWSLPSEAFR